jgi:hypothetical protein
MSLQARPNAFIADFEGGEPPYGAPYSELETMRRASRALIDSGLVRCLTACERLADRVAAAETTLGAIIGSDLVLVAWALLHGLAQIGRARTQRPALMSRGDAVRGRANAAPPMSSGL